MGPSTAITRYELSAPFSEFDLRMNRRGFIGPQVLVPRIVGVQAADVGKIPLEQLLQQQATKRAPGAGYKRGDFEFTKYNYATEEYGWEEPLDDRQLKIYRDLIDAEGVKSERAIDFVANEYERNVAAAVFNTAVWTGAPLATTVTIPWSTHATATPILDVFNAKEKVRLGSGLEANALVCSNLAAFHLANCDEIVDRVKYTERADQAALRAALAAALDIKYLIVAGGLKNTANPQQTANISRIWDGTKAMVCRVAETEDPQEACIGRTFIWSEDGPGAPGTAEEIAVLVEEYREENVRGNVLRARTDYDLVIMYTEAGHLLEGVTA